MQVSKKVAEGKRPSFINQLCLTLFRLFYYFNHTAILRFWLQTEKEDILHHIILSYLFLSDYLILSGVYTARRSGCFNGYCDSISTFISGQEKTKIVPTLIFLFFRLHQGLYILYNYLH